VKRLIVTIHFLDGSSFTLRTRSLFHALAMSAFGVTDGTYDDGLYFSKGVHPLICTVHPDMCPHDDDLCFYPSELDSRGKLLPSIECMIRDIPITLPTSFGQEDCALYDRPDRIYGWSKSVIHAAGSIASGLSCRYKSEVWALAPMNEKALNVWCMLQFGLTVHSIPDTTKHIRSYAQAIYMAKEKKKQLIATNAHWDAFQDPIKRIELFEGEGRAFFEHEHIAQG